jgi:hypothetical protein
MGIGVPRTAFLSWSVCGGRHEDDDATRQEVTIMTQSQDTIPAGSFAGNDEVPAGSFHGGDEVPAGSFH